MGETTMRYGDLLNRVVLSVEKGFCVDYHLCATCMAMRICSGNTKPYTTVSVKRLLFALCKVMSGLDYKKTTGTICHCADSVIDCFAFCHSGENQRLLSDKKRREGVSN